jgi:hypothetical protein
MLRVPRRTDPQVDARVEALNPLPTTLQRVLDAPGTRHGGRLAFVYYYQARRMDARELVSDVWQCRR